MADKTQLIEYLESSFLEVAKRVDNGTLSLENVQARMNEIFKTALALKMSLDKYENEVSR